MKKNVHFRAKGTMSCVHYFVIGLNSEQSETRKNAVENLYHYVSILNVNIYLYL